MRFALTAYVAHAPCKNSGKYCLYEPFRTSMSTDSPLLAGDMCPDFSAKDTSGEIWSLAKLKKESKTCILYFYPKDNTPGCTKQACDFRDNMASLQSDDFVVLGVSKDSATSHDRFSSKYELNFPLLLDEELSLHEKFGTWGEKKNYGRTYMGCIRSTFVIGPDGKIIWARYNVKAKGHVEMLLRELGHNE